MFKKITTSNNCSYKQSVSYKENMPYRARLKKAKAEDLKENIKVIDLKNGFSKVVHETINKKI
ncbi:MAG: hypothetical protein HFI05_08010 [Lachnospiraceae bacterium]|jgi:hypothetical protein|nr:hypothetical protein [Lachnospiraceae bacterium]